MKKILIVLLSFLSFVSYAQKTAGVIEYNVSFDYMKILDRSKKITEDEKNRMRQTFKRDIYTQKYNLIFNEKGSYFGYPPDRANSSWEKTETWVRRDFENNKVLEIQELNSKIYVVEDSIYTYAWKIRTDVKEVAGYLCMSAEAIDATTGHSIIAWFTTDIPLPIGPSVYMGLPGAILEINVDNEITMFTATSVNLKPDVKLPDLPKKIKGTRYTKAKFEEFMKKVVDDAAKSKNYYTTAHRPF